MIEVLLAVLIVAVLAAIALPTYQAHVRKSRRAEAIVALSQVQQAQERYRSNSARYGDRFIVRNGTFAGIGGASDAEAAATFATGSGHYEVSLGDAGPTGYTVVARGRGGQGDDLPCVFLQVALAGGNVTYSSGSASGTGNAALSSANRRCWNR